MKTKVVLPLALQPDDLLEVLTGLWERVTTKPEADIEGVLVRTEITRLTLAPATPCRVKRRT
jgi:hypothetical protein